MKQLRLSGLLFLVVLLLVGCTFTVMNCGNGPNNGTVSIGGSDDDDDDDDNGEVPELEDGIRLAAYIRATWAIPAGTQLSGKSSWAASQIKGEYLTDLMLSFAVINASNKSTINFSPTSGLWTEIKTLKTKYPHLRINLSIGGWGADHFSDMADSSSLRAGFVTNVMKYLKDNDLDGMDIDWEYPVGPPWGQEIKSSPRDKENWVALLKDLRQALDALGKETGKRYYLSACVPSATWFTTANDVVGASEWVDSLTLMAYDHYGSWSGTTGHHANLYRRSGDPSGWSAAQAVQAYLNAGVPPAKLLLGIATYGKEWTGIGVGSNPSLPGLFVTKSSGNVVSGRDIGYHPSIKNYLKNSGYTRYFDDVSKAPFLYNPNANGGHWIGYTDREQIKFIGAYAQEQGLGGLFYWEYAWDMEGDLLKAMRSSIKKD
jgi:chitinase